MQKTKEIKDCLTRPCHSKNTGHQHLHCSQNMNHDPPSPVPHYKEIKKTPNHQSSLRQICFLTLNLGFVLGGGFVVVVVMTTITTSPYLQHFSSLIKQNMDWETLRNYNCGALHFTVLRTWKVILQIFTKTYCLSMYFKSLEKKIFCAIYHNQDPFFVVDQKNIFFSPWYFSYFFSGDELT